MLKDAMYLNVFVIFAMSILLLMLISRNKYLKGLKIMAIVYLLYDVISIVLCYSEMVNVGWDLLIIIPATIVSFFLYLLVIKKINKKLQMFNETNGNYIKAILVCIIPSLIFLIPYIYELYIINNCEYLLQFNTQHGMIDSEDDYLAIINNKPVTLTLQKNLFNREGRRVDVNYYSIVYSDRVIITVRDSNFDKVEIVNNEIESIALDVKGRGTPQMRPVKPGLEVKGGSVTYFPEGKYAIIHLMSEEDYGIGMGEFFYHDGKFVKEIDTNGSLRSVIYYN